MKEQIKKLEERIAALEIEITLLKSAPKQEFHYHYPQPQWPGPYWYQHPISAPTIWCTGTGQYGTITASASAYGPDQ